jgi:murein DD-endopeptidase MepM/ murein hydrolase activator NlpD
LSSRRFHTVAPQAREEGVTTLEPFGPSRAVGFKDLVVPKEDVIEQVAIVGVHDEDSGCTPQEIASGICEEDGANLEEIPAESLTKKPTTLNHLMRAVKNVGDLFRPKSSETSLLPESDYLEELISMNLQIPVEGVTRGELQDSFLNPRGNRHHSRQHLALDIGAPRGTPILAVADGEIVRAARERRGGNAIYLRDSSNRYLFYYCHLSRFLRGLAAGEKVKRGDVLGYVGATGNAHGSHLHFSVTRLPEDTPDFHRGLAVNPYLVFLFGP